MNDEERSSAGQETQPFHQDSFFSTTRSLPPPNETVRGRIRLRKRLILIVIVVIALLATFSVAEFNLSAKEERFPITGESGLTYCSGSKRWERKAIERAFVQMERTTDGERLGEELIVHSVCIDVKRLDYNGGYFTNNYSPGHLEYEIVINRDVLSVLRDDELAALLIHEATHAHREIFGTACYQTYKCTKLQNGVEAEEEVAAHSAEARYWIEIHGPNGTYTGISYAGSVGALYLNELVKAYEQGPDAFFAYVVQLRSDPREGQGI